jgi:ABC-type iron transport system FetAB ATPase subunit
MASLPLLSITSLTAPSFNPSTPPLFHSLSFSLSSPGQILILRGPSGSGKSVVLKCLAELLVYPSGSIELNGKNATSMGFPKWRSRVLYLPQRPALLPGTPGEFWETLIGFQSRSGGKSKVRKDPRELAERWGVTRESWNQSWGSLSGGEAQRIALAVGLALEPEVLLLDGLSTSILSSLDVVLMRKGGRTDVGARLACDDVGREDDLGGGRGREETELYLGHALRRASREGSDGGNVHAHSWAHVREVCQYISIVYFIAGLFVCSSYLVLPTLRARSTRDGMK